MKVTGIPWTVLESTVNSVDPHLTYKCPKGINLSGTVHDGFLSYPMHAPSTFKVFVQGEKQHKPCVHRQLEVAKALIKAGAKTVWLYKNPVKYSDAFFAQKAAAKGETCKCGPSASTVTVTVPPTVSPKPAGWQSSPLPPEPVKPVVVPPSTPSLVQLQAAPITGPVLTGTMTDPCHGGDGGNVPPAILAYLSPCTIPKADPQILGGKAASLARMLRMGLPVPPAFVIPVSAHGTVAPLTGEVAAGLDWLSAVTGQAWPGALKVSVRSGAPVSMPGMMDTLLHVDNLDAVLAGIVAVWESFNNPHAVAYRAHHGIECKGTAVTVQAMVYGQHGATGVVFSRDPGKPDSGPVGEVIYGASGDALVGGHVTPKPLTALASTHPAVYAQLCGYMARLEKAYGAVCEAEFTVDGGALWMLQSRVLKSAVSAVSSNGGPTGALILSGLGASPGTVTGPLVQTPPGILVRQHTVPSDFADMIVATGILTAIGGITSHAAIVARALGKPAVVGAGFEVTPSGILANGQAVPWGAVVRLDGTAGTVHHAEA